MCLVFLLRSRNHRGSQRFQLHFPKPKGRRPFSLCGSDSSVVPADSLATGIDDPHTEGMDLPLLDLEQSSFDTAEAAVEHAIRFHRQLGVRIVKRSAQYSTIASHGHRSSRAQRQEVGAELEHARLKCTHEGCSWSAGMDHLKREASFAYEFAALGDRR